MGLFRHKARHIGPVVQDVKIHYRKLRGVPLPNSARLAHWALQVGEYIYEIATPAKDIAVMKQTLELREALKGKVEHGDEDYDDEELLKNMSMEQYEENPEYEGDSPFDDFADRVLVVQGEKQPLQIGKARNWPQSKYNQHAKTVNVCKTHLEPEKVRERAIHI